jgi:hypothetical protein
VVERRNITETVMTYDPPVSADPGQTRSAKHRRACAMTEYLIAAVLFVAMITTLVYLWKREHS